MKSTNQIKQFVFILLIWIFSACQKDQGMWVLLTTNLDNGDKTFYAKDSIYKKSSDVVRIKTKIVPMQQTIDVIIASAKKNVPMRYELYENFKYSIQFNEVNCTKKKLNLASFEDYDTEGVLIHSETWSEKWLDIPPDSLYEQIYNLVCKT